MEQKSLEQTCDFINTINAKNIMYYTGFVEAT